MVDKPTEDMLTEQEALNALDDLPMDDPEGSLWEAHAIMLAFLRAEGYDEVAAAMIEARIRCGWWYA